MSGRRCGDFLMIKDQETVIRRIWSKTSASIPPTLRISRIAVKGRALAIRAASASSIPRRAAMPSTLAPFNQTSSKSSPVNVWYESGIGNTIALNSSGACPNGLWNCTRRYEARTSWAKRWRQKPPQCGLRVQSTPPSLCFPCLGGIMLWRGFLPLSCLHWSLKNFIMTIYAQTQPSSILNYNTCS